MSSAKRKIQVFLVDRRTLTFLICTFLSVFLWTLIQLSKNLKREFSVNISITNIPKDMFLKSSQDYQIKILAEGKGYELFKYYSEKQTLTIDFNDLEYVGNNRYRLSKNISNKLGNSSLSDLKIQNTYSDTIHLNLEKKYVKRVPVMVKLDADFQKGYQLTDMVIEPDSVWASGTQLAIDSLNAVSISLHLKKKVKASFDEVYKLKNTELIKFNTSEIKIKAVVDKMSEQLIKVPVRVVNVPEDSQIKIFPAEVTVLCSGDLNILKNINPEEIVVEANYEDAHRNMYLPLTIRTKLKRVKILLLGENKVDFLIRKI